MGFRSIPTTRRGPITLLGSPYNITAEYPMAIQRRYSHTLCGYQGPFGRARHGGSPASARSRVESTDRVWKHRRDEYSSLDGRDPWHTSGPQSEATRPPTAREHAIGRRHDVGEVGHRRRRPVLTFHAVSQRQVRATRPEIAAAFDKRLPPVVDVERFVGVLFGFDSGTEAGDRNRIAVFERGETEPNGSPGRVGSSVSITTQM